MPLDPEVASRIAPLHGVTFDQIVERGLGSVTDTMVAPVPGIVFENLTLRGPGGPIPVRIYRPVEEMGPLPALVWCHGGAWMGGDLDMPEADAVSERVAAGLPGVVVSVDYRLAPANVHPAALDDVVAAFEETIACADEFGIDPARVALGGASAGGHLCAAASQVLRDKGGPTPAAMLLVYPAPNPAEGPYRDERPDEIPEVMWLGQAVASFLFGLYLGGDPATATAPVVPAKGELGGLPPTLVTTAEYDALADQAREYVQSLRAAGVACDHHQVNGVVHGYYNMVGDVPVADAALAGDIDWLRSSSLT